VLKVCRTDPKGFFQQHPTADGWENGLADVPTPYPLYRLPELLAADPAAWLAIVEGEKDVDSLLSLGLAATCNPMGAGKWSQVDTGPFAGRRVAIVADKDEPGRRHASEVAHSLHGKAAAIRLLEMPGDAKDAADWLAERLKADPDPRAAQAEIMRLIESCAGWQPPTTVAQVETTLRDLMSYNTENDPNALLGRRWLCKGCAVLLAGQTGLGKSSLAVQMAVTWARGEHFFGISPVRPLRSLIVQAENDMGDLSEMLRGVLNGMGCAIELDALDSQVRFWNDPTVEPGELFDKLSETCRRFSPDLLWIDPLLAFIDGDISKQEVASSFLRRRLATLARDFGLGVFLVHHTPKPLRDKPKGAPQSGDYSYLGMGSSELPNYCRAVLVLRETAENTYEFRAAKRGSRAGLVDAEGQPVTEILLRHAAHGIHWERAEAAEEVRTDEEHEMALAIVADLPTSHVPATELRNLVSKFLGCRSRYATYKRGNRANRIYQMVVGEIEARNRADKP
jgi:hypothetical protein